MCQRVLEFYGTPKQLEQRPPRSLMVGGEKTRKRAIHIKMSFDVPDVVLVTTMN